METLHAVWDAIRPHLPAIGLVLTWLGIGISYYRKRAHWREKRFTGRVNFSLNYVSDGKLQLRTLLETSTTEVWLNDYGVSAVLAASKRTTADQPFIILSDLMDMAFVKRAALNVLSERFADAFLARPLGVPIKSATFVFAVTFENHPDMRTRKFRVLLAEADALVNEFGPSSPELAVGEATHRDRLRVLRAMAEMAAGPGADPREVLGHVQLGLPL